MSDNIVNEPTNEMLKEHIKSLESSISFMDILKEEIKEKNLFLEMLFDAIASPIFYKDIQGIYRNCNEAFSKTILGISKENIIGKSLYDFPKLIPKKLADIYYEKDQELFNNPGSQQYETEVLCSDGVTRHYNFYKATFLSEKKEVLGIIGIMLDISNQKEVLKLLDEKNKMLNRLSITDELTKVYNRRYFRDIFEDKISKLSNMNRYFAFIMFDIDHFKKYNDTFGHQAGDKALELIAQSTKKYFSNKTDYIFRLGGEEFGILYNFEDDNDAIIKAQKHIKIIEDLKIDIPLINASPTYLTISSGLYLLKSIPKHKLILSHIYHEVDSLMYQAKNEGRNRILYKVSDTKI